ncbi:MAG: 50S ribosomal protein L31 [Elusimicrobia bacterium]|nr:50S ribosomal protein L31 [Elusimicrobiota bacterium]
MKPGIHPHYVTAHVSCACGTTFVTRSTRPVIKLEICSGCHPFYTGRQKFVDTAGRVERFKKRFATTGGAMVERKPVAEVKKKLDSVKPKKVLRSAPITKEKDAKGAKKKA